PIAQGYSPPAGVYYRNPPQAQPRRHMTMPPVTPPLARAYDQPFGRPFGGYGLSPQITHYSSPPYAAPPRPRNQAASPSAPIPPATALEMRHSGVGLPWDPLRARIARLEAAMTPADRSGSAMPLPDRLERLVRLLPYGRWGGPLMADRYR